LSCAGGFLPSPGFCLPVPALSAAAAVLVSTGFFPSARAAPEAAARVTTSAKESLRMVAFLARNGLLVESAGAILDQRQHGEAAVVVLLYEHRRAFFPQRLADPVGDRREQPFVLAQDRRRRAEVAGGLQVEAAAVAVAAVLDVAAAALARVALGGLEAGVARARHDALPHLADGEAAAGAARPPPPTAPSPAR